MAILSLIFILAGCGGKNEFGMVLYAERGPQGNTALISVQNLPELKGGDRLEGIRRLRITHPVTGEYLCEVEEKPGEAEVDYVLEEIAVVKSEKALAEGDIMRVKRRAKSPLPPPVQPVGRVVEVDPQSQEVFVELFEGIEPPSRDDLLCAAAPVELIRSGSGPVAFRMRRVCELFQFKVMPDGTFRSLPTLRDAIPVEGDIVVRPKGRDVKEWFEEIGPDLPEAAIQIRTFNLARRKLQMDLFSEAVQLLEDVERSGADVGVRMGELKYLMGMCYAELGDLKRAIPYLNLAANSLPDDPRPFLMLGWVYLEVNHLKEAAEVLEIAGNLIPSCSRIWADIGDIYRMMGKEADANRCYRRASMINPEERIYPVIQKNEKEMNHEG